MRIHELLREESEEQIKAEVLPAKKQLQPVPQFPAMPQQDGDLGQGMSAGTVQKTGERYLKGAQGTFIWDKAGKPSKYITPTVNGYHERHDLVKGTVEAHYVNGPLKLSQTYDKSGNAIGQDVSYKMGDVSMRKQTDATGKTTKTVDQQMGTKMVRTTGSGGKTTQTNFDMDDQGKFRPAS